jgi:DNA-binding response OmpR family regulator
MRQARLLVADNDRHFLGALADYLEAHGLSVQRVSSVEEARRCLEDDWFHLAILDIRLVDDTDEKDYSGLQLARDVAPAVPKIILTSFPSWQVVRQSLGPTQSGAAAVAFLAKQEGMDVVVERVSRLLAEQLVPGGALPIEWQHEDCLAVLTSIEPSLAPTHLASRRAEIDDLFGRAFRSASHLKIVRTLWRRRGYVAVLVFVQSANSGSASCVVICGTPSAMLDHDRTYRYSTPTGQLVGSPQLSHVERTTHFSAFVCVFPGSELETAVSIEELYHEATEKRFREMVRTLYENVLSEWQRELGIVEEKKRIIEVFGRSYPAVSERIAPGRFERILTVLARHLPSLGFRLAVSQDTVTLQFDGDRIYYPNPATVLQSLSQNCARLLFGHRPGVIARDSVLVDRQGKVWITETADEAYGPLIEAYLTMEALVRYDWCLAENVRPLHEFEVALTGGDFETLLPQEVEAPFRRALRSVQEVRRSSRKILGGDHFTYHVGMLFCALQRIPLCMEDTQWTPKELMKAGHALLSSLVLAKRLARRNVAVIRDERAQPTHFAIDRSQGVVRIGNRRVPLHGQSLLLLCALEDAGGRLCSRQDLVERVFGLAFNEADASQVSRLNTAVRRLREKIETDPEHPLYVLTEPGGGYRLVRPKTG